ncbi:hypothetical protein ACFQ3S_17350 [Mucilaginibacter terrae]|uniref:hypothetical protein n=1 Tax=Mucilaginibacter terrae TaxID=1955052 RepID=UPI003639B4EF
MSEYQPVNQITLERIKAAYQASAKIVALYGDIYLPLFERMHQELKKAEAAVDLKTLALQIGGNQN